MNFPFLGIGLKDGIFLIFANCLHNKINREYPSNRGKKDSYDYYIKMYRDQQKIRDRANKRVRIYQFETKECKDRFSHLLSDYNEV